jgi:chorismate synthase
VLGNSFGRIFRVTTAGESYAGAFRKNDEIPQLLRGGLTTIVDGIPDGVQIEAPEIQKELDKRRPGQSEIDTPRSERDKVYILSGVMENGMSTGAPITLYISNGELHDEHVEKHASYKGVVRPGQATYSYFEKYGRNMDWFGAGRASGRETASRVAAGALAKICLDKMGVDVVAYIRSIGSVQSEEVSYEDAKKNYKKNIVNCPDLDAGSQMIELIKEIRDKDDSVGGTVEVIIKGIPSGIGEPVFDKLDAVISHAIMSIGAVKGIEFGLGFDYKTKMGSEVNDVPKFNEHSGKTDFLTNNSGGILGGISNGDEIRFRVVIKPTPTIARKQETIDVMKKENIHLSISTRNDPCICPRIYPVCEAMTRIAILDSMYCSFGYKAVKKMINDK